MSVSTHVLDSATGRPADGIAVRLERVAGGGERIEHLGRGVTGADGRIAELADILEPGTYRLVFGTGDYFEARGVPSFYPEVLVSFRLTEPAAHYHVPLLLGPFSYTTYRGS